MKTRALTASARSIAPRSTLAAIQCFLLACCLVPTGCVFCDAGGYLLVRGMLLDEQTGEPVSGAAIGGRTFTDGQETEYSGAIIFDGSPQGPLSAEDGSFEQVFMMLMPCRNTPPEFPRPDRVEIIVVRDGCAQTFSVEISEETAEDVVDPEFPHYDVIELIEPILVPACEEE